MSPPPRLEEVNAAPSKREHGADLNRIWTTWRRRKWLALLVFAVPLAAGSTVILSVPKLYRSTATILVERQAIPESFVRPTVTSELETRLQIISQEILSRARLEELMTRFDLYPDLRARISREELVERFRRDIVLEVKATGLGATGVSDGGDGRRVWEIYGRTSRTITTFS